MHRAASSGFHRRPRLTARWPGSPRASLSRRPLSGARPPFPSFSPSRSRARSARLHALSRAGRRRLPRRSGPRAPDAPRSGDFVCFEALLPPRVRAHDAPLSRTHRGRCSPGLGPSRALIRSSLGPSLTRRTVPSAAGLVTAMTAGATRRHQVKSDDLAAATTSSAHRPAGRLRVGPCRLSAAALPPSTLETPVAKRALVVLGGVKISTSSRLRETGVLSWGSVPPRRPRGFARRRRPWLLAVWLPTRRFTGASSASSPRARPTFGSIVTRWPPCEDRRVVTVSAVRSGLVPRLTKEFLVFAADDCKRSIRVASPHLRGRSAAHTFFTSRRTGWGRGVTASASRWRSIAPRRPHVRPPRAARGRADLARRPPSAARRRIARTSARAAS